MENSRYKFRAWDGRAMNYGGFSIHATGKLEPHSVAPWISEDNAIMQFTGLIDKNGVDIYEGDILWWLDLLLPITVEENHGYRFMFGKDQICKDNAVNGQVAGNIHENPALLK